MRTNCCHKLLAFNLKFLNFLQFFFGISTVIYSAYLLNQWHNHAPIVPSPPLPAPPPNSMISPYNIGESLEAGDNVEFVNFASKLVSGSDFDALAQLHSVQLPAPWFIYFVMVVGVLLCSMSCIGHIAAEAFNGCCLCFYTLLAIVFILLEAALVAFIAIDQQWDKDLPDDPTGELEKLKSFIVENVDICKWLGLALLIVQALSLLLSLVLRAMISNQREDDDLEGGDASARDRVREPLLNSLTNQSSMTMKSEGRGTFSDIWTTRIRQKYGLNNESSNNQSLNASSSTNS